MLWVPASAGMTGKGYSVTVEVVAPLAWPTSGAGAEVEDEDVEDEDVAGDEDEDGLLPASPS